MHYTLEVRTAEDEDGEEVGYYDFTLVDATVADLPWYDGTRLDAPPSEPIEMRVNDIGGWAAAFADYSSTPVPLASVRLRAALSAAGVSNVEWFATRLLDIDEYPEAPQYFAMNIVGSVAAVDEANSRFERVVDVTGADIFDRLVIDEARVAGLSLFRLAESASTIVVSDAVKRAVEGAVDTLDFVPTGGEASDEGDST